MAAAVSPIPVRNIYYMFCYAWRQFRDGAELALDVEDAPDLLNFLGSVLQRGTERLTRTGLDRDYVGVEEELRAVRGRILLNQTLKASLLRSGRLICSHDELQHDILHNQILKTTLLKLTQTPALEVHVRQRIWRTLRPFADVSPIRLRASDFRRVRLHRNNRTYALLIRICELLHRSFLPNEAAGSFVFRDVFRDEVEMSKVFEEFVRNFLAAEQTTYVLQPPQISWFLTSDVGVGEHAHLLPVMKTDIRLRSRSDALVIDTKFYREALSSRFQTKKLISDNLYQLCTYLKNMEQLAPPESSARGLLLYPTVDHELDATFEIMGHEVSAATVDLGVEWPIIHSRLLSLLPGSPRQPHEAPGSSTLEMKAVR